MVVCRSGKPGRREDQALMGELPLEKNHLYLVLEGTGWLIEWRRHSGEVGSQVGKGQCCRGVAWPGLRLQ